MIKQYLIIIFSDCQEVVRDDGSLACYFVAAEKTSYHEALEACMTKGFTLAEVQGPKDQENLMQMAQPFKVILLNVLGIFRYLTYFFHNFKVILNQ